MNQFQQLSENYTEPGCELIDQLCSEISFMSSIIDTAKSKIEELRDTNITKNFCFT